MDKLIKAVSNDKGFRAFAMVATETVREGALRHDTWSSSTVALGRTLMGGLILGMNQKGDDKITLKIQGNGSGGDIIVDSDAHGHVKGYIQNAHVDMKKSDTGEVMVVPAVGNQGMLTVIKDMGLREPYAGQVPLVTGEIAEDLTYYFTESEQTPSSIGLSVHLNEDDSVRSAGGFFVQVMPGATEAGLDKVITNIQNMQAISELLEESAGPEILLSSIFGEDEYKVLEEDAISFQCDCSKERFGAAIISLGAEQIQEMIDDKHGAEAVCRFCETKYQYSEEDLLALKAEAERK
jgi:molecular chaperone Hsp33